MGINTFPPLPIPKVSIIKCKIEVPLVSKMKFEIFKYSAKSFF